MARTIQQILALTVVTQMLLARGMNYGLNSITLIQVPAQPDSFLTADQLHWTITITTIGSLLGNILAALMAPALGAKRLLLLLCPLNAAGTLAVGIGRHFVLVLVGRALTFFTIGMAEGTVRGFMAEIAPPNRRAIFTALMNASIYAGQVVALLLGSVLRWRILFLLAGFGPAAVCMCGILFLPGSPKWLLTHRKSEKEARKALEFYQGPQSDIDSQVRNIQESLKQSSTSSNSVPTWKLLGHRETLQPLLLACTQMTLWSWGGGPTLLMIVSFVLEPLKLPLSEYHAAALPAIVAMLCSVMGGPPQERFGRLPLLRLGGIVATVGCSIISAYFLLPDQQQTTLGWMVLFGATLSQVAFSGITISVTQNFTTELLPNRTRSLGANIVIATMNINYFILLKVYPLLRDLIGLGGIFLIHAVVNVLQVLFAIFGLHETRGLSLEQIQALFQNVDKLAELPIHVGETHSRVEKQKPLEDGDVNVRDVETTHL